MGDRNMCIWHIALWPIAISYTYCIYISRRYRARYKCTENLYTHVCIQRTENGNREQRLRDEKWLEMEVEVEAVTESACHISAFSS